MQYQIVHTTHYRYSQLVRLTPHIVRLQPRSDSTQNLLDFQCVCKPEATGVSDAVDLDGNNHTYLWFKEPTDSLEITTTSTVQTYRENPFTFLLEPWATTLPCEYPSSLFAQLQPYFSSASLNTQLDPSVVQLAQDIWQATNGNTLSFLMTLNQQIQRDCAYTVRETGLAFPPGLTWRQRRGSCRDLTVLFMEACRAVNLATRFVSGYQEGDPDQTERDLHAWAEVYLPGAGWRGYDPTLGLVVSDRHIAVSASPLPAMTAPISGQIQGQGKQLEFEFHISLETLVS